ncbi:hypothetical protein DPEC_G00088410 [Dallia pectoralis]|uniref:Uncharacterized protein n=1 Tax=Dallia pectoralis TaxID=75939 RepID=A0ACC2H0F0_DALPE|nr:hypothetical protein DPEC_G00088410 [Dallia pectoralis]
MFESSHTDSSWKSPDHRAPVSKETRNRRDSPIPAPDSRCFAMIQGTSREPRRRGDDRYAAGSRDRGRERAATGLAAQRTESAGNRRRRGDSGGTM